MRQVRMTALGLLAGLCMAPALGQTGAAPPTDPPAAAPAAPAAEPAAIAQLRALLGPAVTLEFTRAVPDGAGLRLEGVRLKTEVGARLEAPALTVAEVAADGIGMASAREVVFVTPDDDRVTIGGLELRGLRLDPSQSGPGHLGLDSLALTGIAAPGTPRLALAELRLEGFRAGRPGTLLLSGLEAAGEASDSFPDRLKLARFSLSGLDLPATFAALLAEELPPRPSGDFVLEAEGLQLAQQKAAVGGLQSLRLAGGKGETETSSFVVRGLRLERSPLLGEWLDRFGYSALTGEIVSEGSYDRKAGVAVGSRGDIVLSEVGSLGLTYRFSGLTAESLEDKDIDAWRLETAQLRLVDAGFYRRLVADEARRSGLPEAKIRAGYLADITALLGGAKAAGALLPPLQRFLRGEAQTLELTLQPAKPIGADEIDRASKRGPAALQRVLGAKLLAQ